jgi:hypothetical protein
VPRSRVALVVLLQCAALIAVCLFIGDNGWDDGAITLAFARTLSRHGRVALTPRSEVVEGFSSVSWLLLNALVGLARPAYRATLLISQALSVFCIGACTALVARTCRLLLLEEPFSTLTVIAFAAWGCSFSEAANGMEMGLLAAACLLIVNELLSPRPRLWLLCAGVVVAITTRFEAVLYVGLLGVAAVSVPGRRAFWAIVASGLLTVTLLSGWRLAVFSDVLPNTFWAKRWPPYAALTFGNRLAGALELPSFFLVPLLALGIAAKAGFSFRRAFRARRGAFAIVLAPIGGAIWMGAVTGTHWGYRGRMPYFAFAPVLLLLSLLFSEWVGVQRRRFRVAVAVGAFGAAVAVSMVGFPFDSVRAAWKGGAFGVSPHTYAASGQVFRRFTSAAELQRPTILTADVGGLALCCDEFKIVDLAFLSDRTLGHEGPTAIGQVLQAESPDLIEAHWRWATVGRLYDQPAFRDGYVPAFSGRTKLWVRREVADAIDRRGRGCWVSVHRPDVQRLVESDRYASTELPDDKRTFEARGVVLALDEAEPDGVNLCRL